MADEPQKIEQVDLESSGLSQGSPEERLLAMERIVANLARRNSDIRGIIHMQSFTSNPSKGKEGDLAVVGGKLKIYTSGAWTVVGTQT